MWIFSIYGFYSISVQQLKPRLRTVAVRARVRNHLVNLRTRFPKEFANRQILTDAATDYKFRIILPMAIWKKVHAELLEEQTWSNFKAEAAKLRPSSPRGGMDYVNALHDVWARMYRLQPGETKQIRSPTENYGYFPDTW